MSIPHSIKGHHKEKSSDFLALGVTLIASTVDMDLFLTVTILSLAFLALVDHVCTCLLQDHFLYDIEEQ